VFSCWYKQKVENSGQCWSVQHGVAIDGVESGLLVAVMENTLDSVGVSGV
jgi:hypothetical protein